MAHKTGNLDANMGLWFRAHACRPSAAMSKLCKETGTLEDGEMLTSPEQLQFLSFLAASIGAKNAIEIGVYTGASALAVAEVLPEDGTIVACDTSHKNIHLASSAWKEAGVEHKIDVKIAPALVTLQVLIDEGKENHFDFMYIDADKTNSKNYFEFGIKLLRSGGIITIDNMFYGGQVAHESLDDENTAATRDLAAFLLTDTRVDYALLPIGDGLAIARII